MDRDFLGGPDRGWRSHHHRFIYPRSLLRGEATDVKVRDPVCGMTIEAEKAAAKGTYGGQIVYFCAVACQRRYEREHGSGAAPAH